MHVASADAFGNAARMIHVSGRDVTRKTVRSVVGDGDRLFFVVVRNHAQNGAENFFTGDGHIVGYIGKDGWLGEISPSYSVRLPQTASDQRRAFFQTLVDQPLDFAELRFPGQWAHLRLFRQRIAHLRGFGGLSGSYNCRRHFGFRHQHARRRVTGLACVAEATLYTLLDGLF